MRKILSNEVLAGLWIMCLAFCLGYCTGSQAHAQELAPVLTPDLALARICASEADIQITDDCAAIHQVLTRGARIRHLDYVTYAMMYATGVFDGNGGRPWLAELDAAGTKPSRWPAVSTMRRQGHIEVRPNTAWERTYRGRWLRLLAHARHIIAGVVGSPCEAPPHHWGCPEDRWNMCRDHARAVRAGWVLVSCGNARNEFWREE